MPGQTLQQIRELLAAAGLAPLHRFGQNFLIDLNLMRKLLDAAQLAPGETVLEVGPGTGSLTELLLERGAQVVAVEIDRGLQELLASRFHDQPRLALVCRDVLDSKHEIHSDVLQALGARCAPGGRFKLVANLPYQVATPLLANLLHLEAPRPALLACTLQREVAARLVAQPRTPQYGPISVIAQCAATVETVARLPPAAFWPRPQVESEMVLLRPNESAEAAGRPFADFVRTCFSHRRQTLRRILDRASPSRPEVLDLVGVNPSARPEELSPGQWQRLHRAWSRPLSDRGQ